MEFTPVQKASHKPNHSLNLLLTICREGNVTVKTEKETLTLLCTFYKLAEAGTVPSDEEIAPPEKL